MADGVEKLFHRRKIAILIQRNSRSRNSDSARAAVDSIVAWPRHSWEFFHSIGEKLTFGYVRLTHSGHCAGVGRTAAHDAFQCSAYSHR
jgi:hypothetical protein